MTSAAITPGTERRWIFFVMAALSLLMFSIDGTIVAVALPTLIVDLNTSLVWAGWTLTGYMLTQTVMMPIVGKLAEQFGQMRVFLICVFLFTLGSLLCGLAPNVYVLIFCRVLQALGGGGFLPSATGIVAQQFPETRSRMIGLFASIFPIGGIIGPNLGGAIIEHFGWREIFLINVPIGVLVIALLARQARAQTPATDRPKMRRSLDIIGAATFAGMVVSLLGALTLLGDNPAFVASPLFWLLVGGSTVLLVVFLWQERRARDPVLDVSLVGRHPFLVVNVYNLLTGACTQGFFSFVPYYVTVQYGMGPMESGAILTPRSLVMIVISTSTSFFLLRLGYRLPMLGGLLCVVGTLLILGQGYSSLTLGDLQTGPLPILLFAMALSGLGMGLLVPSSNNAALDLLPERAAVISGIRGLFRSTGGVIGTATIVMWLEMSPDKAAGMREVFTVLGFLMLSTTPLVFLIPDIARENRLAARSQEPSAPDNLATPTPARSKG
ncbi:MAG: MFS transporter [Chloroflexi bacterium]|nr:MFS transporter [Chloroflexota bacterium]